MARLSAAARRNLPASDFAGPGRSYPDQDEEHGRKAVQMASHLHNRRLERQVDEKVHRRYPDIGISLLGLQPHELDRRKRK